MKLLKVVELYKDGDADQPVDCVCFHPCAIKRLKNGEDVDPLYCAVEFEDKEQELIDICEKMKCDVSISRFQLVQLDDGKEIPAGYEWAIEIKNYDEKNSINIYCNGKIKPEVIEEAMSKLEKEGK